MLVCDIFAMPHLSQVPVYSILLAFLGRDGGLSFQKVVGPNPAHRRAVRLCEGALSVPLVVLEAALEDVARLHVEDPVAFDLSRHKLSFI